MDDKSTLDVDIPLRRLTIGSSSSRSRIRVHHQHNNSLSPPETLMNTQPRRQTEWFDELAYRIRPRAEFPAQPSSTGSTESESDSAALRPASPTWYNALEGGSGVSTSSRMHSPPDVPPATSRDRRVGSRGHHRQRQNSPQYRSPSNHEDINRFSGCGSEVGRCLSELPVHYL